MLTREQQAAADAQDAAEGAGEGREPTPHGAAATTTERTPPGER